MKIKTLSYRLAVATLLAAIVQTASAAVLFSDNYRATSNQTPNDQINNSGRQGGTLAPLGYIQGGNVQIGNSGTLPIDPGDVSSGDSFLAAFGGTAYINYDFSIVTGPLEIDFKGLISHIASPDQTDWVSFNVGNGAGAPFVNNSAVCSILFRANGDSELWNQGANADFSGAFAPGYDAWTSYKVILSDSAGTGSAFAGNGTRADYYSNGVLIGTFNMNQLGAGQGYIGFSGGHIVGYDNVTIVGTLPSVIAPVLVTDVQPRRSEVATGTPMTLSVAATGTPLSYQWYNQNGPLGGANTNTYSFNAVTGTNLYQVVITNSAGSVTSSIAAVFSATNFVTVNNFSFENGSTPHYGNGALPSAWSPFNDDWAGLGSSGGGFDAPDGNTYLAINTGPGHGGASGIYQDVGALLPNTVYTLTVAVGRSTAAGVPPNGIGDWSPGIISLVGGTNNTGALLATTSGYPDTVGAWQDYTVNFTNVANTGHLTIALSDAPANTYQASFDNVRLTTSPAPAQIAPTILSDIRPLKLRVATGAPLSLSVTANGSLPLSYQWFNQSGPISGATSATYSFNALSGTNDYFVRVTNSAGVVFSSTNDVVSSPSIVTVNNFSFEDGSTPHYGNGALPTAWSPFNDDWAGLGNSGGGFDAPDGITFLAINTGPGHGGASGIYQDVGALLPNTVYTLTVAVGRSTAAGVPPNGVGDWSPGIISLLGGTNNTGALLATTSGYPDTVGTWQDYSVSFTNVATTGDLTITLSVAPANTYQSSFDNVRLTTSPAPAQIAPTILTDIRPLELRVTTGAPLSLSVTANGSLPLSYQWFNQSGPISGATSATYSFNALSGTNDYFVRVTNSAGVVFSSTNDVVSSPSIVTVNNFSFEEGTTGSGNHIVPVAWGTFNNNNFSTVANNAFSAVNPLAPPADGNDFFAINEGPTDLTGGIYQDVGPLLPNTLYTLTVAIGRRSDTSPGTGDWSPGILSLINGTDNTGTVLATTTGHPDAQDSWQDFTAMFVTGASVSGHLTVALSVAPSETYQGLFDNVRLTKGAPPVAPTLGEVTVSGGNLNLSGTGGTPGFSYTVLTTTNLAAPVWTTSATGTLDGSGAFSVSIPIGDAQASFYRIRLP